LAEILITGAAGLIGTALCRALRGRHWNVRGMDIREPATTNPAHPSNRGHRYGDVRDPARLSEAVSGCRGIVHLGAVSRVAWAEADPGLCRAVNVGGTANVIRAALAAPTRPWIVFASSREVYGEPAELPVGEDHPLCPMNVYARSKVRGEQLVTEARDAGLRTAIVRFSSAYGSTCDHADRVVPAFCRAAAEGGCLRVCGLAHVFDFTHLEDTVQGVLAMIDAQEAGESDLPPVHLVTGKGTTLAELATLANQAGGLRARIVEAPQRTYDVARFVGDPERARRLLGWRATIAVGDGVRDLVERFAERAVRRGQAGAGVQAAGGLRAVAAS